MEAFSSYTLYYLYECQRSLASNSRPGSLATDSDVDDDRPGRHSPVATAFSSYHRRSRGRVSIFDDPGRRDGENDVEANSSPPLT